jgi:hypothetical protein
MKETFSVFDKKHIALQTLALGHGNKGMVEVVKEATNNMSWL